MHSRSGSFHTPASACPVTAPARANSLRRQLCRDDRSCRSRIDFESGHDRHDLRHLLTAAATCETSDDTSCAYPAGVRWPWRSFVVVDPLLAACTSNVMVREMSIM